MAFLLLHNYTDFINIYDDRGCDIWSDNFSYQKNLYHTYYSWLLDYDLNNMTKFYQDKL